jgi:tetratricopeptide (TPR) repeat protein
MRAWTVSFALVLSLSGGAALAERWDTLYSQAMHDLEAGRYELAIAKLQSAVSENPKSGSVIRAGATTTVRYFPYFLLGKAYFHIRKYEEAADFFAKESRSNPPDKLSAAIVYYQAEIQVIQDRKRRDEFDRLLAASDTARKAGAFAQAAEQLEKARETDQTEFEKRGLGKLLVSVHDAEKQRAAEAERQRIEGAFQDLIRQASEKEKEGALADTTELLQKADLLIAGRTEVGRLRNRIKEREDKYAAAKQAASTAEHEGRMAEAVGNLKQAEQANPGRFQAEKLAGWADSLSRQAEIQERLKAGAAALELGQLAQAVENYDLVLRVDPENVKAKAQRSRAQCLQLLAQGDDLAGEEAFPDALQVFELALSQNPDQGPEVYERMHLHLGVLRAGRNPIQKDWLEVMRSSDPERFAKERPRVAAARRSSKPRIQPPAGGRDENVQREVLAALNVEPHEAVRMLEKVSATQKGGSAELESWTGVAYARLSFLTADPKQKAELRAKATQHFRRALSLDPQHRLNARLVPPRILRLFADARQ